jgi:hypothetical protein
MFRSNTHHCWSLHSNTFFILVMQLIMEPGHCMLPKLFTCFSFTIYHCISINIHPRHKKPKKIILSLGVSHPNTQQTCVCLTIGWEGETPKIVSEHPNPKIARGDREKLGQENGTNDRPDRFHWVKKNTTISSPIVTPPECLKSLTNIRIQK